MAVIITITKKILSTYTFECEAECLTDAKMQSEDNPELWQVEEEVLVHKWDEK